MPVPDPEPLLIDRNPLPASIAGDLRRQLTFVVEVDRMKAVLRQSPVAAVERRENDAEHSWHLALMALVLADHADEPVDRGRVVELLVLHDLVEVYAGDVSVHDVAARAAQAELEVAAADRLYGLLPEDQGRRLRAAWEEFEAGTTPEARFARGLDRLQPLLLSWMAGGGRWPDEGVSADSIRGLLGAIGASSASLGAAAEALIAESDRRGYFRG